MAAYTAIDDPEVYFQTELYTGTGSALSATFDGTNDLQPNFIWIATRSTTENQPIYDTIRGTGKSLHSNDTDAEADEEGVSAFNSDGFSLGDHGGANQSSATHVAWCWKATGATSNFTDGTLDSTRDTNTTSKFSMISYTGDGNDDATVGHGLGEVPDLIINKVRSSASNWTVFHKDLADGYNLNWDTADYAYSGDYLFDVTSSLFKLKGHVQVNRASATQIAYAWKSVQGFSRFGSFIGNGNVDGTFVYLGFRPALLIIKCATRAGTDIWTVYDNKRGVNVLSNALSVDTNAAERASADVDFLSNGFKTRIATTDVNPSGETAIYMAFAEAPFVNSNGVPCTAR